MNRIDMLDKKKIFDTIESFNFKEAEIYSQKLIDSKSYTNDQLFRIGAKILTMLNGMKDKNHLKSSFNVFNNWFKLCFNSDQKQTPKNNIIYYEIMFCKSLINEQIFELADEILTNLQSIYPFLCENKYDAETERYIKYLAPLSYNQAINKELIAKDIESAIKLFQHGVKFYVKVTTNFYVLFNSIRIFEINFIRTPRFEAFYDDLFDFLTKSIQNKDCAESIGSCKKHLDTQIFLRKFFLSLFIQFGTTIYSNDLQVKKDKINMYFELVKSNFDSFETKNFKDINLAKEILEIISLIMNYSSQFLKSKSSRLLKENSALESQLKSKCIKIYEQCLELNNFYNYWLLGNVIDLFISSLMNYLNNPTMHSKYLQESLLECFQSIAFNYSENSKHIFLTQNQIEIDSLSKSFFHKPLLFFNSVGKLIELQLKTNNQLKNVHTKLLIESSESIISNQNFYLKWLIKNKVISNDDLTKHFSLFENQTIRITNQFYSDKSINDYIKFQIQAFLITIDRLRFLFKVNESNIKDSSLMKNFRSVGENLILSLRLEEKFSQALDQLKIVYQFLKEFNMEMNEIEWLVTNWCKIKRDMWKSKQVPYLESHKKQTIVDYLEVSKNSEKSLQFLFEEIRNFYNFKTLDSSITMYEEIFYTLEKLENLPTENMLLKCRVYLEMAQFNWNSSKEKLKFKLTSEEYCELAKNSLIEHKCFIEKLANLNIRDLNNSIETEENKENDDHGCQRTNLNNKKRLSSPSGDYVLIDDLENSKTSRKIPKRRCMKSVRSPMILKTDSPINLNEVNNQNMICDCLVAKILEFQLSLYNALCNYSKLRMKMLNAMKNLVDSRMKLKDSANILTNADNLHLQTPSTQSLICPELCDEFSLHLDDTDLISEIDFCLSILEKIGKCQDFKKVDKTLEKQFYESIDLLAQFYGFLGLVVNRTKCLNIKFELLHKNLDQSTTFETIYSNTILNLMKSYLNSNQLKNFEALMSKLASEIGQKKTPNKSIIEDLDLNAFYEKNSYLSAKPEFQIAFYLNTMHYFILKNKIKEAIKLMKDKIQKSAILCGKQNAYFFETKHYLKYLQFILSMKNIGKYEEEYMSLIDKETPLSLLEECYTCIFSVAKYYTVNSIEPFRFLSTNMSSDKTKSITNGTENEPKPKINLETIFFDIGSSESYRILSECMDIQYHLCRHFIDIGRYRDATGYIREGLDVTQLHFSLRRVSRFLLQQINADIIANCFTEAQSRLKLVENLVKIDEIETKYNSDINSDLMRISNFVYLSYMSLLNEIKRGSDLEYDDIKGLIASKKSLIMKIFTSESKINDYIQELIIEIELLSLNYLKQNYSKSKTLVNECIKNIKLFLKNGSNKENWNYAEYLCNLYELDESNPDFLNQAYNHIKKYPHPLLYRKILMLLYKSESIGKNDLKTKCFYLLETQSIALRHKACSIQFKHKRKGTQDPKLIELLLNNLSFNTKNYLEEFIEKVLPENSVVISLVLGESDDLYLTRFEAKKEPILVKLKYFRKLSDEFKNIMIENDRSMKQLDRNKFWSSRSSLNKKLNSYLEEFESSVFSVYKALLLGSFIDFNIEKIIEELKKKFFINSKITRSQENMVKLILLGLEQYTFEDVTTCLKMEFLNDPIDEIAEFFFIHVRPRISSAKRKHVCLLIDKNLHQIPFECFPATRSQPITRMPSIHFLQTHIKINSLSLNKEKAFYIVDPGCDLTHTREKFQTFFEKRKTWDGIIGVPPNETIFKKALTEYELFIYTGHGSGSQYYPSDDVQKLRVQACSILMGCSSGNQYVMGDFEPYGTVLAYILAGCPCIVGNLWDVTDRDIDRLTEEFLESWIKDHDEICESMSEDEKKRNKNSMFTSSICVHLNKARKACKMAYLNGSAPIVYGLPVNFK